MADKSNTVAILALCVSISTAAFSVYQWRAASSSARIQAAIELSTKHIEEGIDGPGTLSLVAKNLVQPNRIEKYVQRLEYAAHLVNLNKVDPNYLSHRMRCEIAALPALLEKEGLTRYAASEATKFRATLDTTFCQRPQSN